MKTIKTVWETTDGKLWKDKKQGIRHQAWLDLVALCSKLELEADNEMADDLDDPEHSDMATAIVANSAELRRILRADPEDGGSEPDTANLADLMSPRTRAAYEKASDQLDGDSTATTAVAKVEGSD